MITGGDKSRRQSGNRAWVDHNFGLANAHTFGDTWTVHLNWSTSLSLDTGLLSLNRSWLSDSDKMNEILFLIFLCSKVGMTNFLFSALPNINNQHFYDVMNQEPNYLFN